MIPSLLINNSFIVQNNPTLNNSNSFNSVLSQINDSNGIINNVKESQNENMKENTVLYRNNISTEIYRKNIVNTSDSCTIKDPTAIESVTKTEQSNIYSVVLNEIVNFDTIREDKRATFTTEFACDFNSDVNRNSFDSDPISSSTLFQRNEKGNSKRNVNKSLSKWNDVKFVNNSLNVLKKPSSVLSLDNINLSNLSNIHLTQQELLNQLANIANMSDSWQDAMVRNFANSTYITNVGIEIAQSVESIVKSVYETFRDDIEDVWQEKNSLIGDIKTNVLGYSKSVG